MPGTNEAGAGGKSILVELKKPLVAGNDTIKWIVMGSDGHRVTGSVDFVVA